MWVVGLPILLVYNLLTYITSSILYSVLVVHSLLLLYVFIMVVLVVWLSLH